MDSGAIITWLVVAAVLAGVLIALARAQGVDPPTAALYLVPASLLGTYMGSESFSHMSAKGPDIGGYFIITSLIFGVVVGLLALAATTTIEPATTEGA